MFIDAVEECDISMTCPSKLACGFSMSHWKKFGEYWRVINISSKLNVAVLKEMI